MIPIENEVEMMYEELAKSVFDDCDIYEDPFGYASANMYSYFIEEPTSIYGKRILSIILNKSIP